MGDAQKRKERRAIEGIMERVGSFNKKRKADLHGKLRVARVQSASARAGKFGWIVPVDYQLKIDSFFVPRE